MPSLQFVITDQIRLLSPLNSNDRSIPLNISELNLSCLNQCCDPGCLSRIWIFPIPDPGSKDSGIPDPARIKELKYFNPKIVSKLSEIWSGMFISDPDLDFFNSSRIQGSKSHRIPDTDPRHWFKPILFRPTELSLPWHLIGTKPFVCYKAYRRKTWRKEASRTGLKAQHETPPETDPAKPNPPVSL